MNYLNKFDYICIMKREFIPYQLALRVKALGFDYDCFAFYQIEYHEDMIV
jgi:hypothetical protein